MDGRGWEKVLLAIIVGAVVAVALSSWDFYERCRDAGGEPVRGVCIDKKAIIKV